jgi:hypothetical protein
MSKLYALCLSFNDSDWQYIIPALSSPLFNNYRLDVRQRLCNLSTHIQKYIQTTDSQCEDIDKQTAWQAIYPDKPYKDGRMRQEMNLLSQEIEKIIPHLYLHKDTSEQQISLLTHFRESPQLHKYFEKKYGEAKQLIEQDQTAKLDEVYYWHLFRINNIRSSYLATIFPTPNNTARAEATTALDIHYMTLKIAAVRTYIAYNKHIPKDDILLKAIFECIGQQSDFYKQHTYLFLYYKSIQLFYDQQTPKKELLMEFINLLEANLSTLNEIDKHNLCIATVNFIIKEVNAEKNYEKRFAFWILLYRFYFDFAIPNQLVFLENGKIQPFTLRNIAYSVINIAATDIDQNVSKMEAFLLLIKGRILGDDDEAIFQNYQTHLLFLQKKYAEALRLSLSIKTPDSIFILDNRRLRLKCYYMLQDEDNLEREMIALKTALYRQSVENNIFSEEERRNSLAFLKTLAQLKQMSKHEINKNRQKIYDEILNKEYLADKGWFLSIINIDRLKAIVGDAQMT